MQNNWQLPETFIAQYRAACKLASIDDNAFANFRNDPHIACVIENTTKEWSDKALDTMGMTPTMIRYWYTLHLLETLLSPKLLWDSSIIEIGGGYGGQCKVIDQQYPYARFTIFDLSEVAELQKRFLDPHGVSFEHYDKPVVIEPATICISWCAWSELSYDLRVEYAEKVISKCDHFFICSNYNKQEDMEILSKYFTGIKEYDDELVQNVIYI